MWFIPCAARRVRVDSIELSDCERPAARNRQHGGTRHMLRMFRSALGRLRVFTPPATVPANAASPDRSWSNPGRLAPAPRLAAPSRPPPQRGWELTRWHASQASTAGARAERSGCRRGASPSRVRGARTDLLSTRFPGWTGPRRPRASPIRQPAPQCRGRRTRRVPLRRRAPASADPTAPPRPCPGATT